jgi:predicted nucleotidyltransferase component of viral defense system
MIAKGAITKRANDEQMPAQTIERDYVLTHICADIGALNNSRLVFKGGTLLRLCYFDPYRYSADLDFSTIDGLSHADAIGIIDTAVNACRRRLELPTLDLSTDDGTMAWVTYVGPLAANPRKLKLDISDTELVENHQRVALRVRWPDLPDAASIEGYTLEEVGAEKLRCIAERAQCRDLYDLHTLLDDNHIEPLEAWELYLRKAGNDRAQGKQRTSTREWADMFTRRLDTYKRQWERELQDYIPGDIPSFGNIERQIKRRLGQVLIAAKALAD